MSNIRYKKCCKREACQFIYIVDGFICDKEGISEVCSHEDIMAI